MRDVEIWKDIEGYEDKFEVSSFGNIRNKKTGRILKQSLNAYGYKRATLSVNGVKNYVIVHRIVAKEFIDNPYNKREVNHIDCNKQNNNISNLEWVTSSENKYHAHKNNLMNIDTSNAVKARMKKIWCSNGKVYDSLHAAALELGLNVPNISRVVNGKMNKTGGYSFCFV